MPFYWTFGKRVCISFDWHNDSRYRNLIAAWLANKDNPVDFEDLTPGAIDTSDVARVKGVLTSRIRAATHTLVIVGEHVNDFHADRAKIGYRNWIWWEIEKSKEEGNSLVAVKLSSSYESPEPLKNANAKWAMSFTQDGILKAISEA
jgi:hypothetical protein